MWNPFLRRVRAAGGAVGLVVAHGAYFGRKIAEFAAASAKIESAEEAKSFAGQRRALGKIHLRTPT